MEKKTIDKIEIGQDKLILHFTDGTNLSFSYEEKDNKSVYKRYAVVRYAGKIIWTAHE